MWLKLDEHPDATTQLFSDSEYASTISKYILSSTSQPENSLRETLGKNPMMKAHCSFILN